MMFDFLKRKSKHEHLNEMLSPYINGELSSEDRAGLEKHLAECEACVRNLHALRLTVELLGQLPKVPLPRPFFVRKEIASRVFRTIRAYAYLKGATAFAAALLIIVLAGDALMQFAFMGLAKEIEVMIAKFPEIPQPSPPPLAKRPPTEVEIYAIPEPTEEEARQIPAPTATPPTELLAELPTPEVPIPLEYDAPSAPAWLIPIRLLKAFLFLLFIILLAIALLVRRSIP